MLIEEVKGWPRRTTSSTIQSQVGTPPKALRVPAVCDQRNPGDRAGSIKRNTSWKPRKHSQRKGFCQDFFLAANSCVYYSSSPQKRVRLRLLESNVRCTMITGFNTDVKHTGTVYHVQTEDKGLNNPLIESLVYVKGAILDAFRTRYEGFLKSGKFSETVLQKILEFQHQQIVASIKHGRYRKGMPLQAYVDGSFVFEFQCATESRDSQKVVSSRTVSSSEKAADLPRQAAPEPSPEAKQPKSTDVSEPAPVSQESSSEQPSTVLETPANLGSAVQELLHPSADIGRLSGEQGIEICVEGSKDFHGGEQVDLRLYVQSRQSRVRIENVQIVIKIIGTTFSPRLYAGKTDTTGSLRMNFSLPVFSGGSAALIIQASTAIGNDEVKYLIKRRR